MKAAKQAALIRAKFSEYLADNRITTDSVIKMVAMEFGVPQGIVIDAVTKGQPVKKGARK